jgi:hypothetical protein
MASKKAKVDARRQMVYGFHRNEN